MLSRSWVISSKKLSHPSVNSLPFAPSSHLLQNFGVLDIWKLTSPPHCEWKNRTECWGAGEDRRSVRWPGIWRLWFLEQPHLPGGPWSACILGVGAAALCWQSNTCSYHINAFQAFEMRFQGPIFFSGSDTMLVQDGGHEYRVRLLSIISSLTWRKTNKNSFYCSTRVNSIPTLIPLP